MVHRTTAAAAVAALACVAGYAALGPSLGLFAWGFFAAAILSPPLSLLGSTLAEQAAAIGATVGPILFTFAFAAIAAGESAALPSLALLLLTFTAAAWALVSTALRLRVPPTFAAALGVILGLAWLTWPVWGSTLPAAGRFADLHPLLAANRSLSDLGIWTERPIAYHLTALGQDVPYRLPSPAAACLLHAAIAATLLAASFLRVRRKPAG